jgi:hypothetical protein
VRVEEDIKVGERADGIVYDIFFPGMYALALAMFFWPAVLMLVGLIGVYWSLFSGVPAGSGRSAR